jgi:dienelactone hydrolase
MASKPKELLAELSHPGPHEVLRGNLTLIGFPGAVFTPKQGLSLPAIAFGHGWLQPVGRYRDLLRHLASWGIVAAAPETQRGPLPSHRLLAADLNTALELITSVRLGRNGISVDPEKLGLAGHSLGGGAAVLAAREAQELKIRAVATVSATQTMPPATEAAKALTMPSLHLAAEDDLIAPPIGHAEAIAKAWGGPSQLRIFAKSSHLGVTEGKHWSQLLLHGKPHYETQRLTRALFTAFFLTHLTSTDKYRVLLESDVKKAPITFDTENLETVVTA